MAIQAHGFGVYSERQAYQLGQVQDRQIYGGHRAVCLCRLGLVAVEVEMAQRAGRYHRVCAAVLWRPWCGWLPCLSELVWLIVRMGKPQQSVLPGKSTSCAPTASITLLQRVLALRVLSELQIAEDGRTM